MRILAFETSAKAASVALVEDGALVAEYFQNSGQTHSRTATQMAADLLRNCDLTPGDVDAAACAAGPGSFTGVRIGVAAAKGFAWGRELPLFGVSTLEAMAWNLGPVWDGIVVPAMDARRNQVYAAAFCWENGVPKRLLADSAISLQELEDSLKNQQKPKILVGDGAVLCYNTFELQSLTLAPEHLRMQRAAGVALAACEMARQGEAPEAGPLTPTYLRLSQAERERLEKEKQV